VLITGCSAGGIGYELAKEYHAKGLRVFATARRPSTMDELRNLGIECLQLDVTKVENIREVRDQIAGLTGGSLDILVNNAGQSYSLPATDINMDEVRAMFDINVFAVFTMVQEFVNLLIASGEGCIVNVGSVAAIVPYAFGAAYNASKGALHSYGNCLRVELEPFNIKVITIVTGGIQSNIASHRRDLPPNSLYQPMNEDFVTKRQGHSQKRAMPTAVYARSVVAATLRSSPKAWVWSGRMALLTWFVDTFFPRTTFDYFIARMFGLDKFKNLLQRQKKTV